jgi:integrase
MMAFLLGQEKGFQMSLTIYHRVEVKAEETGKTYKKYEGVEEGVQGRKMGHLEGPFYLRRNGGWFRLSGTSFADAQTERNDIEGGKVEVAADGRVSLKTAVAQFLEMKKRKNESTVENYTYILNEFLEKSSAKFVDEFKDQKNGRRLFDEFISILEKDDAAPKTIHNKLMVVVFMLKEAGVEKPSRMVNDLLPTIEEEVAEPYTEDELKKIFNTFDMDDETGRREYTAFMFFLVTACREKEVAFAQWSDLVTIGGLPHYRVQSKAGFTTKNHKKRDVQIDQELVELLTAHKKTVKGSEWIFPNEEGNPEGHFLRKFKKACFKAGLNCGKCKTTRTEGRYEKKQVEKCCKDYSEGCEKHYLHRLRKTRATFWHEHGISLRTIQVWLAHESLETTQKYLGIQSPKETERIIAKPMF